MRQPHIAGAKAAPLPGADALQDQAGNRNVKTAQSPNPPSLRPAFWRREHHLDKMTLKELVVAYFTYPAIIAYLALSAIGGGVDLAARRRRPDPDRDRRRDARLPARSGTSSTATSCTAAGCGATGLRPHLEADPLRPPPGPQPPRGPVRSAPHHAPHHRSRRDPDRLGDRRRVRRRWTGPNAWGAAAAALATGLLTTCFYEFVHCIQHLAYKPKNKTLAEMKRRHMAHHFHDESGNFGITTFFWDKVFKTYYDRPERPHKSPTVFNLGYTEEVAEVYPYVAELSGGVATGHPRQRDRRQGGARMAPRR
jgi:hypothetical protein